MLEHLELGLRTEPAATKGADGLVRVFSLLIADLNRKLTTACSSGLCHELHLAGLLERNEVVHSGLDRVGRDQQAMVLQDNSLDIPGIRACSIFLADKQ